MCMCVCVGWLFDRVLALHGSSHVCVGLGLFCDIRIRYMCMYNVYDNDDAVGVLRTYEQRISSVSYYVN